MNRTIILVACIASTLWCNAQVEVATSQTDSTKRENVSPVMTGDSIGAKKKTDETKIPNDLKSRSNRNTQKILFLQKSVTSVTYPVFIGV